MSKNETQRRHSVAAMPASSSSLSVPQRNGHVPSLIAPQDRVRRVSFEVPEQDQLDRRQISDEKPRARRHSSVLNPSSGLLNQQRTPLATLSETENAVRPFPAPLLTAGDLIDACIRDADDYVKPDPIPGGSSAMLAILHDMKRARGDRDAAADSDDDVGNHCDVRDRCDVRDDCDVTRKCNVSMGEEESGGELKTSVRRISVGSIGAQKVTAPRRK